MCLLKNGSLAMNDSKKCVVGKRNETRGTKVTIFLS
jgi:hypothetical protein